MQYKVGGEGHVGLHVDIVLEEAHVAAETGVFLSEHEERALGREHEGVSSVHGQDVSQRRFQRVTCVSPDLKGRRATQTTKVTPTRLVLEVVLDSGRGEEAEVEIEAPVQLFEAGGGELAALLEDGGREGRLVVVVEGLDVADVKGGALFVAVSVLDLEPLSAALQIGELDAGDETALLGADHGGDVARDAFQLAHAEGDLVVVRAALRRRVDVDAHVGETAQFWKLEKWIYSMLIDACEALKINWQPH